MKTVLTRIIAAGAMCLMAACAPMKQAPLVYVSKQTIGIDISATQTETPGVSLNLGYKSVDAAYVPVAVVVECPLELPETMLARCFEIYPVTRLMGGSDGGQDRNSQEVEALVADLNARGNTLSRLKASEATLSAQTSAIDATGLSTGVKAGQQEVDDISKKIAQFDSEPVPADGSAPVVDGKTKVQWQQALVAASGKTAKFQADLNGYTAKDTQLRGLRNDVVSANAEFEQSLEKFKAAVLKGRILINNKRDDALSVYGTFNVSNQSAVGKVFGSEAKDSGLSNGLIAGKVFSTGVASQNLTQDLNANLSRMNCVNAIRDGVGKAPAGKEEEYSQRFSDVVKSVCGEKK